ncbi:RNA-directed DNA polymerase, eukaryota [Tanacetum coccineum]
MGECDEVLSDEKSTDTELDSMEREIIFPSYLYPKPTTEDNHGDNNDDGWQIANRRQNTKVYGTQHIITSYFFTEFPPGLSETALRKTFAKYGRITDVYMAKNPTINGKAFGFARFINVQNLKSFETTLNSILIGTHHLKVNIARFQRGKTNNHVDTNPARQPTTTPLHLQQPTNTHKHKTYDSVRIAAFTHIAGTWGEVIFPETCNKNSNNLVAGKVCIHTKCMEVIQHNMPVVIDDEHFCVRIKKIMGECDEVLSDEKSTDTELDEDCTSSNDDSFGKEDVQSEEDDDDFYDDGSDCNLFMDEVNEIQGGGGWIQNDVGDYKDISSPQSSKSDNIQNENFTG